MPLPATGTFTQYPALVADLPPLVKAQQKVRRQIEPLKDLEAEDARYRKEIDALLIAAGLGKGESVSCGPFDVTHCERAGSPKLNRDLVKARFVAGGVDPDFVEQVLHDSTETGEPALFAKVEINKGAIARLPAKFVTKNSRAMRRMREAS